MEKQDNNTCYYLLLNPDAGSMEFMLHKKTEAARAGIPEKYTQTSKPHVTLVSWEDKPEADEWMVNGITTVLQRYEPLVLRAEKANLVGPQWGKHLIVDVTASETLSSIIADLKKEVPGGRKGKLHLTLAYKIPGDKIPETLPVANFDVGRELVFDHLTLLKYTAERKYIELGKFTLANL
ncbi:2'-5' RNA ligase family protein [Fluviicola sp.]|uniref:2'-5' RNA ligase family protein n=1 Tax=Fluviicola sp. TaxID=1917219 RepID=UPI0031DCB2CD